CRRSPGAWADVLQAPRQQQLAHALGRASGGSCHRRRRGAERRHCRAVRGSKGFLGKRDAPRDRVANRRYLIGTVTRAYSPCGGGFPEKALRCHSHLRGGWLMAHQGNLTSFSRRSFLQVSTAASAAVALRIVTEPMLAYAQQLPHAPTGGGRLNANENPLGPCAAARSAVAAIMPEAGRYRFRLAEEFVNLYAQSIGVKADNVRIFAGSSEPLHYT